MDTFRTPLLLYEGRGPTSIQKLGKVSRQKVFLCNEQGYKTYLLNAYKFQVQQQADRSQITHEHLDGRTRERGSARGWKAHD